MTPAQAPAERITGDGLVLRLAGHSDLDALAAIIAEPEVAPWWPMGDPEGEFLNSDYPAYVIEVDGATAGVILYSEDNDPFYRRAGLDVAVATAYHGRALGRTALKVMMRHLIRDRGHHRLTIDPAAANGRAIAAYEDVGFRRVGVMRGYERGPDGTWHDNVLMDALASELDLD